MTKHINMKAQGAQEVLPHRSDLPTLCNPSPLSLYRKFTSKSNNEISLYSFSSICYRYASGASQFRSLSHPRLPIWRGRGVMGLDCIYTAPECADVRRVGVFWGNGDVSGTREGVRCSGCGNNVANDIEELEMNFRGVVPTYHWSISTLSVLH
jgi:hypothetical protein